MQDIQQYAQKHNVTLQYSGPCQFCGADVKNGVEGCLEAFNTVLNKEYQHAGYAKVNMITVDTHALQHSEIHGRSNNPYHLLSIHLLMQQYADNSRAQRHIMTQLLKKKDTWPELTPPPTKERGELTITDIIDSHSPEEHAAKVEAWGQTVWKSWQQHHSWASQQIESVMEH